MKTLSSLLCVFAVSASLVFTQTISKNDNNAALQRAALLLDVKTLALEVPKLDGPLARAVAQAEIADAAWTLDQKWARSLLRDAYQLTYLTEEELHKIGPEPPGSAPRPPSAISRARMDVRRRILSVARRDKVLVDQLLTDSSARLTKDDRQMMYAQLTRMALDEGDNATAIRSIQENMQIDATQLMFVELVNELALKDRTAADKLILECIAKLSTVELVDGPSGRSRADITLRFLVFPNSFFPDPNKRVPNPGAEVMRAYVRYVIETLSALQPESLPRQRSKLLTAWLPLNPATHRGPGGDLSMESEGTR